MKRAAIGLRVHSGWAALVAVSGAPGAPEILDRRRIVITDGRTPGAKQPYHFAANRNLPEAESYLTRCAAVSGRLASLALREAVREWTSRGYRVVGAAVLLASGRPLPSLSKILASHPLIHTAEGEFFRRIFREACLRLRIVVLGVRERDLEALAAARFGKAAAPLRRKIARLGKSLGPPWTQDQKAATLAACLLLAGKTKVPLPGPARRPAPPSRRVPHVRSIS